MSKKRQNEFLSLYEPVHVQFERFCRARVYGEMDFKDLMNETLLLAYQKCNELRNKESFFSFLCGISVRILANDHRRKKITQIPLNKDQNNIQDLDANTEKDTAVYLLYKALAMLPDKQRESLVLFEISGFSIKEVAQIQEASETSVKQRLKRGRERLKEILAFEATLTKGEETI